MPDNRDETNIATLIEEESYVAHHVETLKSLSKEALPSVDQGKIYNFELDNALSDLLGLEPEVQTETVSKDSIPTTRKSSKKKVSSLGCDEDGVTMTIYAIWVRKMWPTLGVWISPKAVNGRPRGGSWKGRIHQVAMAWSVRADDRGGLRVRADGSVAKRGDPVLTAKTFREAYEIAARYLGTSPTADQLPPEYPIYHVSPSSTNVLKAVPESSKTPEAPASKTPEALLPKQHEQVLEKLAQQVRVVLDRTATLKKERTELLAAEHQLELLKHETIGSLRTARTFVGVQVEDLLAVVGASHGPVK